MEGNAFEALRGLADGRELCILTKGQFSLIDLIIETLKMSGPADVVVSTWTAARKEIAHAHRLLEEGGIRSLRWLVDFSFPRRQPGYCALLREKFGVGCIRATKNHAKFVMIRNEAWNVCIRTSMNLNQNARLEYLEVSNDATMCDFFEAMVTEIFEFQAGGEMFELRPYDLVEQFEELGREMIAATGPSHYGLDLDDASRPGLERL